MILYFSIVTRGTIIIFGHKFLTMAQEAYVIAQPGSLLHLSLVTMVKNLGNILELSIYEILVKFHVFFEISTKFREISASFFEIEI